MAREGKRGGCVRGGLFGCLGIVALVALFTGAVSGFGYFIGPPSLDVQPLEYEHAPQSSPPVGAGEPGRIVLDVSMTRFTIVPGPTGEPVRLRGQYDAGSFEIRETWGHYGETGWTYELGFKRRGGLRSLFRTQAGDHNRVELVLPRDVPLVLEGQIGIGESVLELGGLSIGSVDLAVGIGSHEIGFSEPLTSPLESFRLEASIGELRVRQLGNASPAEVSVDHDVGEVLLDLRGAWQRDADVTATCGIGECRVRVPQDVHLVVRRAGVTIGDAGSVGVPRSEPPEDAPTVTLSVSGSIGEVQLLP